MTLREIRKKQNKTLKEIAQLCCCSVNAIWLYETGKRLPSINRVIALAKALNVSAGEIMQCFCSKAYDNVDELFKDIEKK